MPDPNSIRLDDGYATLVEMADFPDVKLYEKEVEGGGFDGGEKINITTMRNSAWETFAPRSLKTALDISYTAAFATDVLDDLEDAINHNQELTITFSDGSSRMQWGYLKQLKINKMKIGSQPEADVVFVVTNRNNSGVETAPVYTGPPG